MTAQEIILNIVSFSKDSAFLDAAVREREEELSRRTLEALLDMRIKFPGKTDEEAEMILESVSSSWITTDNFLRTIFRAFIEGWTLGKMSFFMPLIRHLNCNYLNTLAVVSQYFKLFLSSVHRPFS